MTTNPVLISQSSTLRDYPFTRGADEFSGELDSWREMRFPAQFSTYEHFINLHDDGRVTVCVAPMQDELLTAESFALFARELSELSLLADRVASLHNARPTLCLVK
jgi:hypothetical protein